jgi:hypothetical protein
MCKDKKKIRHGRTKKKKKMSQHIQVEETSQSWQVSQEKTEVISHGITEWKGKKAKTKSYKLQRIKEIIFVIYLMRVSCVM